MRWAIGMLGCCALAAALLLTVGEGEAPAGAAPRGASAAGGGVGASLEVELPAVGGAVRRAAPDEAATATASTATGEAPLGLRRYSWRLVDGYGAPLSSVMIQGSFLARDRAVLAPFQVWVDDSPSGSFETVRATDDARLTLRLECGLAGHLPLEVDLPLPGPSGSVDLGDLELPTVRSLHGLALLSGRVLDESGAVPAGLRGVVDVAVGDRAAWRAEGGGVVEIDSRTGRFDAFGPARAADSLALSFSAPGHASLHRDRVPVDAAWLELRLAFAQVVRASAKLPGRLSSRSVGVEFWSDRRLAGGRVFAGFTNPTDLLRPPEAETLRLIDPLCGFELHRFELPPAGPDMLVLDPVDLTERVRWIEVRLVDARGESLGDVSVQLERADGERLLRVAQNGVLGFHAPRDARPMRVSLAPDGIASEPARTLDPGRPAAILSFP